MAKKKSAKPARERTRQGILPNTLPEPTKALIQKAEELETVRDERMRLTGQEADLQKEVIEMMHSEKLDKLELSSGRIASLTKTDPTEKVKLTTPKSDAA